MTRIIISPLASEDLETIYNYIAQENKQAALKTDDAFNDDINNLGRYPEIGRRRPEWTSLPLFFLSSQGRYWIIYTWDSRNDTVEIVRVTSQRQDTPLL